MIALEVKAHGDHWDVTECALCRTGGAVNLTYEGANRLATSHVCPKPSDHALHRPSWDAYFARIAQVVASRGNCLRKQVGCVIVVDQRIVSAGYNGPPSGVKSCVDGPEFCPCASDPGSFRAGTATISRDLCPALHAEQNAVAYAGRECKGGTAYITTDPCRPCYRLLQSAGVVRIVVEGEDLNG